MSKEREWSLPRIRSGLARLYPHGHPRYVDLLLESARLHSDKNADYAGGGDPLGNFRRTAAILENYPELDHGSPVVVAALLMMKQVDAVLWLLNTDRDGDVESVATRLADVAAYAVLARILWEEGGG